MDKKELVKQTTMRMDASILALDNHLKGLRVGRASANFLDPVHVEVYGSRQAISQIATISTPDAKTIAIQVWDKANVKSVEKAIIEANLGLNPSVDGQIVRISIPPLSQERRKELVKLAAKYAEDAKVAIRNIRRDIIDELKTQEKNSILSKDEMHSLSEQTQKITDEFIAKIDSSLASREKEILAI